jgi:phosphoglycolate phosphatase
MSRFRHVIWDFNGTLLDDVACCVETLNLLLSERSLPALSEEQYRAQFGFPVRGFYEAIGVDLRTEDFALLSQSYIARYLERVTGSKPHEGAHDLLDALAARGVAQSVLSAMEQTMLVELLSRFALSRHLLHARGLKDHRADTKLELGVSLLAALELPAASVLLVGDTLHDHEVASAMGCACVLVSHGHQSRARLEASGMPIVDSLSEVLELL